MLQQQISVVAKNMIEKFAQTLQQHFWGKLEGREIVHDNETCVFQYKPEAEKEFLKQRHLRHHLHLSPNKKEGGKRGEP
jgi:hypothetical protein